jgi:N-hydroxyarylamine O-acetyltransferase
MDVAAYLKRINYSGPIAPNLETLRELHRAHLLAVPFENLDIHLGRAITLDTTSFYHKIVEERRGGFCYEMNGLFAALLQTLGFQVTLLSAGVGRKDGSFGPEFDHLALQVELDGPYLVDVGFGAGFLEPLRLELEVEQAQGGRAYRFIQAGERWTLQEQTPEKTWENQYNFSFQPRQLADFAGMCYFHQTSPDSSFPRRPVCVITTPTGKIQLIQNQLAIQDETERQERTLTGPDEYISAGQQFFGLDLGNYRHLIAGWKFWEPVKP